MGVSGKKGQVVVKYAGATEKKGLLSKKKQTLEVRDRNLPGGQGENL